MSLVSALLNIRQKSVCDSQPMSCNSILLTSFYPDVAVSPPQPQPIDDIAGIRAAPWDDSPPRAVQVVSRHRAIDLMPLFCRNRHEQRCNLPFSPRLIQINIRRWGLHERQSHGVDMLASTRLPILSSEFREIAPQIELVGHPSLRSVELSCFKRSKILQTRPLITAGSPRKLGLNRTHLSRCRSLA